MKSRRAISRGGAVMTLAGAALVLTSCLEWEMPDDGGASEAEPPSFHALTPAGIGPVAPFDPGDAPGRCRIVCRRYDECFATQVDQSQCLSLCQSNAWVADPTDLACFVWSSCSDLQLCQ